MSELVLDPDLGSNSDAVYRLIRCEGGCPGPRRFNHSFP